MASESLQGKADDELDSVVETPADEGGSGLPPTDLEPLSMATMGRFFAVPLIIILIIVGGAVTVVLMFGGPAAPDSRTMAELLQALEAGSGVRRAGVLLPREKEMWQTALELSVRLENKDKDPPISSDDLQTAADRLGAMVRSGLEGHQRNGKAKAGDADPAEEPQRLQFLIRALGRTGQASAVASLIEVVERGSSAHIQVAMQMLGDLHEMPQARQAIGPIVERLTSATETETRLVATTVLSVLATPDDRGAIEAIVSALRKSDGEVAWSAALALARLGDSSGKTTLFDLLDRSFLESGDRYQVVEEGNAVARYPLPPSRVDALLIAAVDAASVLSDADLWETIEALESDRSPSVRARVEKVIQDRSARESSG